MIDRGKRDILGVGVSIIDYEHAVENIMSAAKDKRPYSVSALAVHGIMTGVMDPEHGYRLNQLNLVVPDGQPVRWAINLLYGEGLRDRVSGPELTKRVCRRAGDEGLSVYLFGSRREVLDAMVAELRKDIPRLVISGSEPSSFRQLSEIEHADLDQRIRSSGADILLVGLGCPRQEVFAYEHTNELGMPVLAVGAAFDILARFATRAPMFLQTVGLEWLFRLAVEPRRLWRRYALLNPVFVFMLARQRLGLLQPASRRQRPPARPLRFG